MKARYLILFFLLPQFINIAPVEFERPVEHQPVDNKLVEEREQKEKIAQSRLAKAPTRIEPTAKTREEKLNTKATDLISNKRSFIFESKEDRIKKFKDKFSKLSDEAKDIMLELKKPESIKDKSLDSMITEVDKLLEQEKSISGFGLKTNRSDTFIKELETLKGKLKTEQDHQKTQTEKTLEFAKHETAKPTKENPAMPESKKVVQKREELLNNYSFDPETRNVTLKNDNKANEIITRLQSLLQEKTKLITKDHGTDIDSQIQDLRNSLINHLRDLKKVVIGIYGKNSVEETKLTYERANHDKAYQTQEDRNILSKINTKLSVLAKEQVKNNSLSNFFDNQIREINENPSYPNPKPDVRTIPVQHKELDKKQLENKDIERLKTQSKTTVQAQPNKPREKTPEEQISDKRDEQSKIKNSIQSLDLIIHEKRITKSQTNSDAENKKLQKEIDELTDKKNKLQAQSNKLETEIGNLYDNKDRIYTNEEDDQIDPGW